MTEVERKLWRYLRRDLVDGLSFRRQHPVGNYVLDFYCPRARLAIELDGSQHGEPAHASWDRMRDDWLAGKGISVLRVWNGDVMSNLEGVWETIRHEALRLASTSPSKWEVGAKRREGVGGGSANPLPSGSNTTTRSTPTPALPLSGGGGKGMVECGDHGTVRPAFVCGHLVETLRDGVARGLLWSRDEDGNVNAYCDQCDRLLEGAGDEWTDEVEAQAKVTMICEACFRMIERVNGGGS